MKKKWLWALSLTLVIPLVALCGCGASGPTTVEAVNLSNQQEGIWVTGQGKVTATPDIATLRLGIEAQEATVAEAQAQAVEAMDRVMTALKDNGVAKNDIQTQYFNIHKVTRWNGEKDQEIVIGYRVTNIVAAKIRDIEKAGSIIDAVAAAGGDLTRIDSIGFSIEDPSDYYEDAREEAMADAKDKAEQLAKLGGVKLGKPTYISEGFQVPPPIYREGLFETASSGALPETPITPVEMEISLNVQVVYAILN